MKDYQPGTITTQSTRSIFFFAPANFFYLLVYQLMAFIITCLRELGESE